MDYMNGYYTQTSPHRHNGGLPPLTAEEIYWDSSKTATNFTWPLRICHYIHLNVSLRIQLSNANIICV